MKSTTTLGKAEAATATKTRTKTTMATATNYFKLINYSLKSDIIAGIFIFGWICALLSVEVLSFQFGSLTAKFYEIIPRRNGPEFGEICVRFGTFLVMMALGKGSLLATRGLLARAMRRNLTQSLHCQYFKREALKFSAILDNPDQRITEDVDKFTRGLIEIVEIIFMAPILVIFYTIQVSQRLGPISLTAIYAHFLLSVIILRLGMTRLKKLTVKKERREADFRAEHVNISSKRESFILIGSDTLLSRLHYNLNSQLRPLLFTAKQLIITESVMELGKNFFSYSGALLNFSLLAWELFWGRWQSETDAAKIANLISMTSFLSLYLIFQLSRLTGIIDLLGVLNGQVERLSEFVDSLTTKRFSETETAHSDDSKFKIEFKNFNLFNNSLYGDSGLSFIMESGENALISGPNGSGKSSLLRIISGVWHVQTTDSTGSFKVTFPKCSDRPFMMTCPQTCVLFSGSLYDLLGVEPVENDLIDEEKGAKGGEDSHLRGIVEESLKLVRLPIKELEPFTQVRSISTWQSLLTPGQEQRLSLARGLIHCPHLLALDETCLAMNSRETKMLLDEFRKRQITLIFTDPCEYSKEFESFFQCKVSINKS